MENPKNTSNPLRGELNETEEDNKHLIAINAMKREYLHPTDDEQLLSENEVPLIFDLQDNKMEE